MKSNSPGATKLILLSIFNSSLNPNQTLKFGQVQNPQNTLPVRGSWKVKQGSYGVQYEATNPSIVRETFLVADENTDSFGYRVELITDRSSGTIYSTVAMDQRYQVFEDETIKNIISSQGIQALRTSPYAMSQFYVPELVQVDQTVVSRIPVLKTASVKMVMVRKISDIFEFKIVYQVGTSVYEVMAMLASSGQVMICSYSKMPSVVQTPRLKYGSLQNVTALNLNEAQQTTGFGISNQKLMTDYGHFLGGSQIMQVLTSQNGTSGTNTFNIVYKATTGIFMGIVEFDPATQQAQIRALVLQDGNGLDTYAADCQVFSTSSKTRCATCNNGFSLGSNGSCYPKLANCKAFAGESCLLCDTPYQVKNNTCTSTCGKIACA